jgi:hypothetical protein
MGGVVVPGMSRGARLVCPISEEMFLITEMISSKGAESTDGGIKAA